MAITDVVEEIGIAGCGLEELGIFLVCLGEVTAEVVENSEATGRRQTERRVMSAGFFVELDRFEDPAMFLEFLGGAEGEACGFRGGEFGRWRRLGGRLGAN